MENNTEIEVVEQAVEEIAKAPVSFGKKAGICGLILGTVAAGGYLLYRFAVKPVVNKLNTKKGVSIPEQTVTDDDLEDSGVIEG